MREDIRLILANAIPDVEGRVLEPSVAGKDEEKPFLVVREGTQDPGDPYSGFATIVEVWPFVSQTSFRKVDALSQKVIEALHQKRFDSSTGEPFFVQYIGTAGDDVADDEWQAYTRGLRFQVFSLAWMVTETVEPDPIAAMRSWTEQRFPDLQTDPLTWRPSDEQPALYWRLAAITGMEMMNWGAWITARIVGHLLAPTAQKRVEWLKRVVPRIGLDRRTYLSDGSPLFFESVSADSTADPFRVGQIQVVVRYGLLGEMPNVPALDNIHLETEDGAGGVVGGQQAG